MVSGQYKQYKGFIQKNIFTHFVTFWGYGIGPPLLVIICLSFRAFGAGL